MSQEGSSTSVALWLCLESRPGSSAQAGTFRGSGSGPENLWVTKAKGKGDFQRTREYLDGVVRSPAICIQLLQ